MPIQNIGHRVSWLFVNNRVPESISQPFEWALFHTIWWDSSTAYLTSLGPIWIPCNLSDPPLLLLFARHLLYRIPQTQLCSDGALNLPWSSLFIYHTVTSGMFDNFSSGHFPTVTLVIGSWNLFPFRQSLEGNAEIHLPQNFWVQNWQAVWTLFFNVFIQIPVALNQKAFF